MNKPLVLLCYLIFQSSIAFCQQLTKSDTLEIKERAQFSMEQFEEILNRLAKSTTIIRNPEAFLRKFYENSSPTQLFLDSAILIEDDLNPNASSSTSNEEKKLLQYLNDFSRFYGKSIKPGVQFSGFQISDIQQDSFRYIHVIYESQFLNKHKNFDKPYEKQKRIATLKVEPSEKGWESLITDISFFRTGLISPQGNQSVAKTQGKEEFQPMKPVGDSQSVKGNFSNVDKSYKRGAGFNISWNYNFEHPVNLILNQGDVPKISLGPTISNQQYKGTIPKSAKPGDRYNFQLVDPVTDASLQSGFFKIRRKFPLGLQVPLYIGVGVAAYLIIEGIDSGGEKGGDRSFPNPPDPNHN